MTPREDISNRTAIIGLIVILALAAWMRFDDLGRFAFWTDEMYHVIAAQSLLEGGEPVVPGRGAYWRSFIVTAMTAASFSVLGESEWSARLPFALVSLVFLAVAYRVLAARFTRLLSLTTVFFLAMTPQFMQIGRECRMYGPLVLLYFLGVFMVYRAVESPPAGPRRRPRQVMVGLAPAAVVFALALSVQPLAVNFGLSLALYCLVMAGHVARSNGMGEAARSRYAILLGLMAVALIAIVWVLPGVAARFVDLARTPMPWDTRGHPAPFCIWFFNYYYPTLWFIYPIGAVILIHRWGRLGLFIVCAFLPVLLAHMYFFTSRIAERYLVYILPFFFLTSACVIEAVFWGMVGWLRGLRASGARATAVAAGLAFVPASWLLAHPWLAVSRELRAYGVGPDWKQIAPQLREACDTGVVVTHWPREVTYYGGRFPDYFATRTYEYFGDPDHAVTIGGQEIEVKYLRDAESLTRVLESGRDVYFVTTGWAFENEAFLNDAMRELVNQRMTETAAVASGRDRAVIYRTRQDK